MASATAKKKSQQNIENKTQSRPALDSMDSLLACELANGREFKKRMIRILPQLADIAQSSVLRQALRRHTVAAILQAERLEALLSDQDQAVAPTESKAMAGLIKELNEVNSVPEDVRDAKLISGLQRMVHIGIASAGTAAAHSRMLGERRTARALQDIVAELRAADEELTAICLGERQSTPDEMTNVHHFARTVSFILERRNDMPQYSRYRDDDDNYRRSSRYEEEDDRGYGGRSEGGRRSSEMQGRDEYGQFTGYRGGGGRSRYEEDEDDRGYRGREDEGYGYRGGSSYGRSEGGRRSSQMQGRDEYGQFTGYRGGGGRSRYEDDDEDRGYSSRGGSSRGQRFGGEEGRRRGGEHSAEMQERDEYGRFVGTQGGGSRSRYDDDDDDRGYSSRSSSRSRYESSGGGRGGRGGEYVDSAGRHYSRESWERAQEGRARGGQHSHSGRD